ncbi:MAG: type II toxin-antitoxin system PemK/MazF family toxin [Rhodocyclaceae bacterium]|nr:type II toxin-antitoxin system PemK/MazF family toxin [Rhodocyclaceae bacterium]
MMFHSGDIVLVPFPFTDLSASKRRPALLLRSLGEFGDWLCLPVTTQNAHAVSQGLHENDFANGKLPHASWVRLNRPTLLSESIMLGCVASLKPESIAGIYFSMYKALDCGSYAVMEPAQTAYRVASEK